MRPIIELISALFPTLIFGTHAQHLRWMRKEIAANRSEIQTMHAAAVESADRYSRLIAKLRALVGGESK